MIFFGLAGCGVLGGTETPTSRPLILQLSSVFLILAILTGVRWNLSIVLIFISLWWLRMLSISLNVFQPFEIPLLRVLFRTVLCFSAATSRSPTHLILIWCLLLRKTKLSQRRVKTVKENRCWNGSLKLASTEEKKKVVLNGVGRHSLIIPDKGDSLWAKYFGDSDLRKHSSG